MSLQVQPVFLGATRPTMLFGVTLDFFVANIVLAATVFFGTGNMFWMLLIVPLHGIAWVLCRNEPRMLSLVGMWSKTKGACLTRAYWKASSTAPLATGKPTMTTFPNRSIYRRDNPTARHLPYSVMIDEATVRTTNQELMRTFVLQGVAHESADDEHLNAWQEALNITIRNIASPKLALATHVVRQLKNDYPAGDFEPGFAADLNEKYRASLTGEQMYVNELYVTVIYRPHGDEPVKGAGAFFSGLSKPSREEMIGRLEDQIHALDDICHQVQKALDIYTPRMLTTYERNGLTFSETLEFLAFLVNGERQRMPVPTGQIKYALGTARLLFGKEALEQRGLTRSKVSAMVSIKEYPPDTQSTMMNGLLGAPYEFVLAQSFTCLSKGAAQSRLSITQNRMINAGDFAESQIADIQVALDQLTSSEFVMGVHNLSLQVKAENIQALANHLADARAVLSESGGMVLAREDVALEAAFWSALPCNFGYRPRSAPITSHNFAAFASMHNYPSGQASGNYWGEAVALLKTASGAPYYFNFHRRDVGHTTIIGPTGTGKTVVQTFLISMLEKHAPSLVFFDKDRGAEIFIRAQRGHYTPLRMGARTGFNPFQLEPTPAHKQFLAGLIRSIVTANGEPYTTDDEHAVDEAINVVYDLDKPLRRFSQLLSSLDTTQPGGVHARLSKWCGDGRLAWVFDNPTDDLDFKRNRLLGFDLTEFLDTPEVRTPIILYLFRRMDELIDGRRFGCFIDEFWKPLSDPAFQTFARDKLKTMRKENGILVTATQSPSDTLASPIAKTVIEQTMTQIFLPNPMADHDDYRKGFKLTEREYEIVRTLGEKSRRFLVKQGASSVVAELNLEGFDDELAVLSGTKENLPHMEAAIAEVGDDPAKWLPVFHAKRRAA